MPLRVVEVLAQLGRPEDALRVLQTFPQGSRQDPEGALRQAGEATLTITILLHCGHFSEAYFEVTLPSKWTILGKSCCHAAYSLKPTLK